MSCPIHGIWLATQSILPITEVLVIRVDMGSSQNAKLKLFWYADMAASTLYHSEEIRAPFKSI